MSPEPIVRCEQLRRVFQSAGEPVTVLDDVSFEVAEGEFIAVIGPSGSGKSTLLGLLAGLDRPTSGRVVVAGQDLTGLREDGLAALRRTEIGFIFQSFQLLDNLTALENVLVPLELLGVADAAARSRELLTAVGLAARTHHYPSQLSGGEQQRVAVARAFGTRPRLLLADEPTGNLDRANGIRVLQQLLDLREAAGTTLVLVTHDSEIAAQADRRLHLEGGRVVRDDRDNVQQQPGAVGKA
ncbi:MAG: ABC transporter ATP-binding protein [Planctomycetota bacterium]